MFSIVKKLKLKDQVFLLIGVAIFSMVFIQSIFYLNFSSLTQQNASIYAENIMKQVEDKLNSTFLDIEGVAQRISYNNSIQELLIADEPIDRIELSKIVTSIMDLMKGSDLNIENIRLIDRQGREIHSSSTMSFIVLKDLVNTSELLKESSKTPVFSPIVYDTAKKKHYYSYISPIFSASSSETLLDLIGYCIIICRTEQIQEIVKDVSLVNNSVFLIQDMRGNIAAINNSTLLETGGHAGEQPDQGKSYNFKSQFNNKDHIIQERAVAVNGWKLISILPKSELKKNFKDVLTFGVSIILVMVIVLLIVGFFIISSLTVPIARIVGFTGEMKNGGRKKRLEISAGNEIGMLADNINLMLDEIEFANQEVLKSQSVVYEAKLSKKQAELSALQSQINPHFLYNTLDCIRSIALAGGIPEIVGISTAMARIFRYSIKGKDIVAVKEELECIKDYISIMRIRYLDRFSYTIDVDDHILQMKIPKMILQPIVENAIYHGLEQKRGKGELFVSGKLIGEKTVGFEVIDNGVGMEEDELNKLTDELSNVSDAGDFITGMDQKRSIGLLNIYNRVKLTFGNSCGLKIYSNKSEGTRVIIYFPSEG